MYPYFVTITLIQTKLYVLVHTHLHIYVYISLNFFIFIHIVMASCTRFYDAVLDQKLLTSEIQYIFFNVEDSFFNIIFIYLRFFISDKSFWTKLDTTFTDKVTLTAIDYVTSLLVTSLDLNKGYFTEYLDPDSQKIICIIITRCGIGSSTYAYLWMWMYPSILSRRRCPFLRADWNLFVHT